QLVQSSGAPALLVAENADVDPHSAELAALAVWGGHPSLRLPDRSVALSRRIAGAAETLGEIDVEEAAGEKSSAPAFRPPLWRNLRHHLLNAELTSWTQWRKHPLQLAGRLIPLRLKEQINRSAGRPIFNLSFYLQFQPNSVITGNTVVEPLHYFPA